MKQMPYMPFSKIILTYMMLTLRAVMHTDAAIETNLSLMKVAAALEEVATQLHNALVAQKKIHILLVSL